MIKSVGEGPVAGASAELNRLTHEIIGAAIEVHRVLGPGLLEALYEEALCVELTLRRVPFTRQQQIDLSYKGHSIGKGRLDLLVDNTVVVELKSLEKLLDVHAAQMVSYLRTTGYHFGLLINFNVAV